MAKITVKFKEAVMKEMPIDKEITTIGRNPNNDIYIDNPIVSNFHAKLIKESGEIFIEDQNSTNGTFVNSNKIDKVLLKNNDVITIGKHTLVFSCPESKDEDKTVITKKPSLDATMVIDISKHKTDEKTGKEIGEKLGCFSVIEGSADKTEYELKDRLTVIGKDETAGIRLKGFFAPKIAALVNKTKTGYFIAPSESERKIKINGQKVEGRYELKDGDIVESGNIKLQFYLKD
ncbi:MAG: FHA domain-containing protein [Nitrospiraceae bacterium]|nr:FHA domain-containing protein [Nitrospiraceae bacterium]